MNILQMSVQAGGLIVAILVIRALALRWLPKTTFLILWGVTLCRLLVPVSIPSRLSVYSMARGIVERLPSDQPAAAVIDHVLPWENLRTGEMLQILPQAQEQARGLPLLFVIWLAGVLAFFLFFSVVYCQNSRALRFALPVREHDFLHTWLTTHSIMRTITLWQSDRMTTPITFGILRPRIILPKRMNLEDKQLLAHVLTHEYYHIRRFDGLWKLLCVLALCLHWFNPMVWAMFFLLNRDLELTCDELVIRHLGAKEKTIYAYSLIGMAEQRRKFSPLYQGFSKNAAEERIVAIMKYQKPSAVAIVAAIMLVAGTATAFGASAVAKVPLAVHATTIIEEGLAQDLLTQQKPLPEYTNFGISYDANGKMLYHSKLVRYFWDGYDIEPGMSATRYDYFNEDGVVDVHTLRSVIDNGDGSVDGFGELIDIVAYSQKEFAQRDLQWLKGSAPIASTTVDLGFDGGGKTFKEIFARYKDLGVSMVESNGRGGMGNIFFQGRAVKTFIDEKQNGGVFMYQSVDGGEITIRTVYDKNGNLTGIKVD